jgi:hypothetical protein
MNVFRSRRCFRIFAAALVLATVCATAQAAEVHRILPLGDSITQAEADRASYRYPLWKMLIDAGLDFEFVGSMNAHLGVSRKGPPPQPDYRGRPFDPDHEGHFGWTTGDIINGRWFDTGSGSGKLEDWVNEYRVDIALVHLGTNDAFTTGDNASTVSNLKQIIRILRAHNPEVSVLLAQLIPAGRGPEDDGPIESLNREIPRLAQAMHTARSPVIIVDQYSGFDPEVDTYDGVHPNESGEGKIARRWFDAIMELLEMR